MEEITLKFRVPYENGNFGNQAELEWANSQPCTITIVPVAPIIIGEDNKLICDVTTMPEQMEIIKQNPRYELVTS